MPLALLQQKDFRSGMWPTFARHLIPANGAFDLVNYLLDNEGSAYKRGGSEYKSDAAFATGLRFIWDATLPAGQRTLVASATKFGVLGANDATMVDLAGSGLAYPTRGLVVGGLVFVAHPSAGTIYGGSRMAADYSTGTVTLDYPNKRATGTGTSWTGNVDAGMLLRIGGADRYYPVASVDSNTQLTLTELPAPTATVAVGGALPMGTITVNDTSKFQASGTFTVTPIGGTPQTITYTGKTGTTFTGCTGGTGTLNPGDIITAVTGTVASAYALTRLGTMGVSPYVSSEVLGVVDKRLLVGAGDRVYESEYDDPHTFLPNNYHRLPGGGTVLGIEAAGDVGLIFTDRGVWGIYNLVYPLVDTYGNVQQRLQMVAGDLALWGQAGLAQYQGGVVAPCTDDIYLIAPGQNPVLLSEPITALYRTFVKAGYRPGGSTIFRGHYFLPIVDASGNWIDTLVCRLDRPTQARYRGPRIFPWCRLFGAGVNVSAWARRAGSNPSLLGAGRQTSSRILKCDAFFTPDAAHKLDHDGTVPQDWIITRDVETNNGNLAHARRLRVRYELTDAAADDPKLLAFLSDGALLSGAAFYGDAIYGDDYYVSSDFAEFSQLEGQAPEDDDRHPYTWPFIKHARYVRFRIQSSGASATLRLRGIDVFVRPTRKVR